MRRAGGVGHGVRVPRVVPGTSLLGRSGVTLVGDGRVVELGSAVHESGRGGRSTGDTAWVVAGLPAADRPPAPPPRPGLGITDGVVLLGSVIATSPETLVDDLHELQQRAGRPLDGLVLRGGTQPPDRLWPTVAGLVGAGTIRCAGIETDRVAVLERCALWHPVDLVVAPSPPPAALAETCRWSGVALVESDGDLLRLR
jgi:hypothetical protein